MKKATSKHDALSTILTVTSTGGFALGMLGLATNAPLVMTCSLLTAIASMFLASVTNRQKNLAPIRVDTNHKNREA